MERDADGGSRWSQAHIKVPSRLQHNGVNVCCSRRAAPIEVLAECGIFFSFLCKNVKTIKVKSSKMLQREQKM